jgi:poly-gamma-glutamate capsule biosynthesis protein CapA/YwtB (metallophosphatase superfamily)
MRARSASPGIAVAIALALMAAVAVQAVVAGGAAGGRADRSQATQPRPPPSGPVTVAFGGDVHFESWLGDAVRDDPRGALRGLRHLVADADLAVVNLETAITEGGTPAPKQHTFRGPPEGVQALAAAGVDIVSIANNHGMDFGAEGLDDTLRAVADADLAVVGGGRTEAEAYRAVRRTIRGRRIAVLGATQVLDGFALTAWDAGPRRPGLASAKAEQDGLPRLLAAVRRAAADSDTVVVVLHWGRELEQCPLPQQRELARQLRDAGADVVVGGHAHRLGPGGFLGDSVVHYGLGNLVFYAGSGPATDSGVLWVTIAPDDTTSIIWRPAVLRAGVATRLRGAERREARAAWRQLRSCSQLVAAPGAG